MRDGWDVIVVGAGLAGLVAATAATAIAQDLPGKGVVVKPVKSSIAEETFQTLLVGRALQKLGAVPEGILRRAFLRNGQYLDQMLYAIVEDDWRAARSGVVTVSDLVH